MLTGIHLLLTYKCSFECDHCFLYCSPNSEGTFTRSNLKKILIDAREINSVEEIYFEGGEPFLFYPLLLEGVRLAHELGFRIGIVTNGFWITSDEVAELFLKPLSSFHIFDLSLSIDSFHGEDDAKYDILKRIANKLNIDSNIIRIEAPKVEGLPYNGSSKGKPIIGGDVKFRGRAADKLISNLPAKDWHELNECPYEDLENPERVHIDSYGNVHICQGISIGNAFAKSLGEIIGSYKAQLHPICKPLTQGGPLQLAEVCQAEHENEYVDECHFCFSLRRKLLDRFPEFLLPRQVYGI